MSARSRRRQLGDVGHRQRHAVVEGLQLVELVGVLVHDAGRCAAADRLRSCARIVAQAPSSNARRAAATAAGRRRPAMPTANVAISSPWPGGDVGPRGAVGRVAPRAVDVELAVFTPSESRCCSTESAMPSASHALRWLCLGGARARHRWHRLRRLPRRGGPDRRRPPAPAPRSLARTGEPRPGAARRRHRRQRSTSLSATSPTKHRSRAPSRAARQWCTPRRWSRSMCATPTTCSR